VAGDRFDQLELNMVLTAVPHDGVSLMRRYVPTLSDAQLPQLPTVLAGSPRDMTEALRHYCEAYEPTYMSVQRQHAESFSKVIAELR
jgi:hypothetical protein